MPAINPDETEEVVSKEDMISHINEVQTQLDDDSQQAEIIQDNYAEQNNLYRQTADNDDGNEDRPDTYSEDNDNVQGCDRNEELVRLGGYLKNTVPHYQNRIDETLKVIENAETPEQLDQARQNVEELADDYENARGVIDDV